MANLSNTYRYFRRLLKIALVFLKLILLILAALKKFKELE